MPELEAVTIVLSEPTTSVTTTTTIISPNATATSLGSATGDYPILQKYFPLVLAVAIAMICLFCLCLPGWLILRYCRRLRASRQSRGGQGNRIENVPPALPPRARPDNSGETPEMQEMYSNWGRVAVANS